jgi:parvulin-like peptidyl-prolyl isomerase
MCKQKAVPSGAAFFWIGKDNTAGIMDDMLTSKYPFRRPALWLVGFIFLLSACSGAPTVTVTPTLTVSSPTETPTPAEPTSPPEPAAVVVNGERIPLAWFQSEVSRYLLAQEDAEDPIGDEEAEEIVLNDLIDQALLAQAARQAGVEITDQALQEKLDALSSEVDLEAWMSEWGYTEEELRYALRLQILAAEQRDQIIEAVGEVAEQVELRQVFAYTEDGAEDAFVSLNSGRDFEEVAFTYDPVTGGYLGWVPRGYLLIPELEEAAFNLEVGAFSEVIGSEIGYHIVKVLDRDERPLTNDARMMLQRDALHNWLAEQRELGTIEVLTD